MEANTTTQRTRSGRSWWVAGIVLAVVIVVTAAAAVLVGSEQEPVGYPPGSPEAALQAYFEAWQAGDFEVAYSAMSEQAQRHIPRRDLREAATWADEEQVRVWVDRRTDHDDRAVLHLTIETSWDGLFGPDRDRHQQRVTMVREDGTWKIDTPMFGYHPW